MSSHLLTKRGANILFLLSLNTMTRSLKDINDYYNEALNSIDLDHPHYDEIKDLLKDQVADEVYDYAHTVSD